MIDALYRHQAMLFSNVFVLEVGSMSGGSASRFLNVSQKLGTIPSQTTSVSCASIPGMEQWTQLQIVTRKEGKTD